MSFLKSLAPAIGTIAGNLIAPGIGGQIGGALGGAIASSGGGGKTPTLTAPGGAGALTPPKSISTPSLSLAGGRLQRTAPAFIPGQPVLAQPGGGGQMRRFTPQMVQGTLRRVDEPEFGRTLPGMDFASRGAVTPTAARPTQVDPRLQEEQDVRRRLSELNPMLGDVLQQIGSSRGDVGGLQAQTTQLGTDIQQFREGLQPTADLQPSADDLRALASLAQGADISEIEALGFDASVLKDEAGNIDTAKLQQAIQMAEELTGQPLTEEGIAAIEAGGQLAGAVPTKGAFETPLGALAQARGAAVSEEPAFNQLREDISSFRETLSPQFNEALQTNLREIEAERATAAGDLRSQFAERRISGSSFAADKISQLNAEFGRREDVARTQFFQAATDATLQAFGIESDVLNTQVGQRLSAAAQRAAFAAEEAGILDTEIGRQLEQAGIISTTGNRLAEIGLLQSDQDLAQARTLGDIAQNEIDAELKQTALQGELTQLGANIFSEGISQRLASLQTAGNLTAQEASTLAQQSAIALSEAALRGDLFQIERSVLDQGARNIGLSMGLNEQQAENFSQELLSIQTDAQLIQQTTLRELQELAISGNIANGILASTADISAANADLAIRNAEAQGKAQAGLTSIFTGLVEPITSLFDRETASAPIPTVNLPSTSDLPTSATLFNQPTTPGQITFGRGGGG